MDETCGSEKHVAKEDYAESCRECDGDIRGIDNDWCFKCDKPIKLVLKTI